MRKVLVLLVVTLFMAGLTNAQTTGKMKIGIGPYIGIPMGNFGDVTSVGFGGLVQGEYDFGNQFVGTVTTGYLMFPGKDITEEGFSFSSGDWSIIPILVGAKYFFTPNWYGAAQLGLNMVSYTNTIPVYNFFTGQFTTQEVDVSDSEFGINFGVGYDMGTFDFLAKYGTFGSNASSVSLTVLYKFGI